MPHYNLAGLSTDSFEQLIQALSLKVIGRGGVIFGAGPDGAREATFEGRLDYPSQAKPWHGYLVMQAKFLQKPTGDTKKDGDWLLKNLEAEFAKFTDTKRQLRKPDYYILCTNVVLTPVWKTGTKDRAFELFRNAGTDLKGFDIWDYDKIERFLDDAQEIRASYAAWVQPGDVLSAMLQWIGGLEPNFEKAIANYLQKQLLSDHYLRLDQSGHAESSHTRVAVERVFIDLPASRQPVNDPPDEGKDEDKLPQGIVATLLDLGARKWDPATVRGNRSSRAYGQSFSDPGGRVVLVGGPGQGKTTTAQYLCQLYRAALLQGRQDKLDAQVAGVIHDIEDRCAEEKLSLPGARRYPIRVELKEYASEIASSRLDRPQSLLEYCAQHIRKVTSQPVDVSQLRRWLAAYPWLLVLDGLDEVPPSANRSAVIQHISEFLIDLHDENADVVILATTRPQGYRDDLGTEVFQHWYLSPLSLTRAMRCARRFAQANMSTEDQQRVLTELTKASATESTARLMRSPLQVTILATLATSGPVPQDRWRLFSDYYRVIYRREAAKHIWQILETNQADIDAIHNIVGLFLQAECERGGQTDARLSRAGFEAIVERRLRDEGNGQEEVRRLTQEIAEATGDRLVFLVGLEADRVGFEIRSLQEFMAARALLNGHDETVLKRLSAIAPASHWRNVFIFAAANYFAEKEILRDSIVGMCASMNQNDDASRVALPGSQLALDLLEAGIAGNQPKYLRTLAVEACKLLDRPPCELHSRLARIAHLGGDILREEVRRRVELGRPREHGGSWRTLLDLINGGTASWARDLADRNWPEDPEAEFALVNVQWEGGFSDWLTGRLASLVPRIAPSKLVRDYMGSDLDGKWLHHTLQLLSSYRALERARFRFGDRVSNCGLAFGRIGEWAGTAGTSLIEMPTRQGTWAFLQECSRFALRPSPETLAAALRRAANCWPLQIQKHQADYLPWPIGSVIQTCKSRDQVEAAMLRAAAGEFGDHEVWSQAENRWKDDGITEEDILAYERNDCLPGRYMGLVGYAVIGKAAGRWGDSTYPREYEALAALLDRLTHSVTRAAIAALLLFLYRDRRIDAGASEVAEWLRSSSGWLVLNHADPMRWSPQDRIKVYETAAEFGGLLGKLAGESEVSMVAERFLADPDSSPLVRLLAHLAIEGDRIDLPNAAVERLWSRKSQADSGTILIAQGHLSERQSSDLAQRIAGLLPESPDLAERVFRAANRADADEHSLSMLANHVYSALPPSESSARASAAGALDDVLRRRRSALSDVSTCQRLELPSALYN